MESESSERRSNSLQDKKETPEWSDDDIQHLKREKLIAEALKIRSGQGSPKAWWQKILETSGGAALITVLIGGLIGQLISMSIQRSLKDREQSLIAYNKFLDQGADTVNKAYDLIGNCFSATDDLVTVAQPKFKKTDDKRNAQKKFDEIVNQWQKDKIRLGLLMKYYHHNDGSITTAWKDVQEKNKAYMECAGKQQPWDEKENVTPPCEDEKNALIDAVDKLTERRLEIASKYDLKIID
jgi:hypothetical protein